MHWALILVLAMLAGDPAQPAKKPALKSAAVQSTQPTPKLLKTALSPDAEDPAAEDQILELANQSRQQAGLAPLRTDNALAEAAREHARLMVERQQLSHQFDSEPPLMDRLLEKGLRLDQAGENVAYHATAEKAFEALMLSAPHRRNLLDPNFNVAGMAAFWKDGRLYVVQDFAHQLP